MGRIIELRPDSAAAQIAGTVPPWIVLPGNLLGREREVMILDTRREAWLNSTYPIADVYLTRRLRHGSLWKADRGP